MTRYKVGTSILDCAHNIIGSDQVIALQMVFDQMVHFGGGGLYDTLAQHGMEEEVSIFL